MSQLQAKARRKNAHPGVRILQLTSRSGRVFHQARFKDSETGRLVCQSLDALGISTAEGRRGWAVRKSAELRSRKNELKIGAEPYVDMPIEIAVQRYLETSQATLRPKTYRAYHDALQAFATWAQRVGVTKTPQLNSRVLDRYRSFVIASPKLTTAKGGRRGGKAASARPKAPRTMNAAMEYVRTWLRSLIRGSMVPALTQESIASALRRVPTVRPQPEYLGFGDARKLLEACLAHDADCFRMTRREKEGRLAPGRMPKFTPIAPVALALILSGMRRGELLGLEWRDIDLGARDEHGNVVGEIRIRPEATKTKIARTIDLSVSPALRQLLAAMRERCDGTGRVFDQHTQDTLVTAQRRLIAIYGAPKFDWQLCRSTCATVLVNAPAIFGSAAAFRESRQLGHSVTVAERCYAGLLRGIPGSARTVEAAMQVAELAETIVIGTPAIGVATP